MIFEVDFYDRCSEYQGRRMCYNRRVARVEVVTEDRIPFALTEKGYRVEKILRIRGIVPVSDPSLSVVVQATQSA